LWTICFRVLLTLALVVCTYFATTARHFTLVEHFSDKVRHALAFSALALLADFSFPQSRFHSDKITAVMAYGILIEVMQHFLPWRTAEVLDVVADGVGLLTYAATIPWLRYAPILRQRWRAANGGSA
jgi:VanZ family protein